VWSCSSVGTRETPGDGGPETAASVDGASVEAGPDARAETEAMGDADAAGEAPDVVVTPDVVDAGMPPAAAWVMGYYYGPDESTYPVSAVEWSALTHVAAAFYRPQTDGSLDQTLGLDATAGPALATALVTAAHANGVKAIASIGGASSQAAFEQATASGTLATFVTNLGDLLTTYGYDGIDIDWEPLATTDQPAVLAIATQLRAAHPGVVLTIAVNYTNPNDPADLSGYVAIAAAYDQVNVETYGMAGLWTGWKSWHTSALHYADMATPSSIDESVGEYVHAGVPAGRLGFGASAYGLCYGEPVTGPDQSLGDAQALTDVSYADIFSSYYTAAAREWDPVADVPYLSFAVPTGAGACTFITYDDAQSLAGKGAYLQSHGLGGLIVWRIGAGYSSGQNPLLDAVRTSFRQ
jgi:chitinase